MQRDEKKILILGMGNEILTDDGIGIKLLNDLKEKFPYDDADYEALSIGGLEIVELLSGYKTVIILDAIKTMNGVPGSIYRFVPDDFKATLHIDNIHDISFLNALKVGKKLGYEMPSQIEIIAVEIIEDMVFSSEFTPRLQEKYPEILSEVSEIVKNIISAIK
ncbi:MAG: hydrogenase maturation protease [Bacteroidota bacterium]